MVNMWLIIGTISIVTIYLFLYELVIFNFSDPDYCNVQNNYYVSATSIAITRSIEYTLWYFPILWLFWPPSPLFCRKGPTKTEIITD